MSYAEMKERRRSQDFQDFRRRRGDERTAAGDRKENWIYGSRRRREIIARFARSWRSWKSELDLWITARRAGRRKSRQKGEKRNGSMDHAGGGRKKSPRQRREHRQRGETAGGAPDGAPPRCSFYAEKNYFNSTVARRFLARPSLVLLSATGSLGPLLSQTMLAAGAPRFTM